MEEHQYRDQFRIGRRRLLAGGGAAAVVGSVSTVALTNPEAATKLPRVKPAPSPIPGGIEVPDVGLLHAFIPGPEGSTTPFAGLPGMGLDVEPSTLTDFEGFTVFAVLSGQAEGSDGKTYNVEFDVRVMRGEYVAEDGSRQWGTFGFF